ncbi:MAG: glycosyltransferase family 9 protein [Cyclobacteriaceae bacterium]|nr:glycosyltransferase family 9 protein [Cytophagales bacterium]MCZ8327482.1 glycosyltransferase family 9 protein [Cyclobacteriaceae bacterium]
MQENYVNQDFDALQRKIKTILVIRPNHRVGNLLLVTPLLQEIEFQFPHAKIDLFDKGNIAKILFKQYGSLDEIIQLPRKPFKDFWNYLKGWFKILTKKYDLVINVNESSKSGSIAAKLARGTMKLSCRTDTKLQLEGYKHMGKYPVYSLRFFIKSNVHDRDVPYLNLKLSEGEIERGKVLLDKILPRKEKIICLYTFATAKKMHSKEWWKRFFDELEKLFPDHTFFELLPKENVSQLDFKLPTIYSEDLREMGGILANCKCFIGADSGIMHLASASNTPTFGFFNVTDVEIYRPYNRGSLAIDTTQYEVSDIAKLIQQQLKLIENKDDVIISQA